jgi:hypothetical protein
MPLVEHETVQHAFAGKNRNWSVSKVRKSEAVTRRRTDNSMAKRKKGQTTIYKTYT